MDAKRQQLASVHQVHWEMKKIHHEKRHVENHRLLLEPQTTIYKLLFQLDDSKSLYRKRLFHQTSIYIWVVGVPGFTFRNLGWVKFKREVNWQENIFGPLNEDVFPIKHVDISASYACVPEAILKSFGGFYLTMLLMEELLHQVSLSHYLQGFIHTRWLFGISEPSTLGLRFGGIEILSRKMVGSAFEKHQGNCVPQRFGGKTSWLFCRIL